MKNKNIMYCLIYRLRKQEGINIDTRTRTIFFNHQYPESMEVTAIKRLCDEYGFGRQARII